MELKQLFADEDAVSPVIGVILMVAITVILAAVIGTFVLGLGNQVGNNAPSATMDFAFENNSAMAITHDGGDELKDNTLTIKVDGTLAYEGSDATSPGGDIKSDFNGSGYANDGWGASITSGDTVKLYDSSNTHGGETVRVIWNSPGGGDTAPIGEREWSG